MSRAAVDSYRHQNQYAPSMQHSPRMNPGGGGRGAMERGGGDQKPSRLLQMRNDYQQRLLKEKEEKMIHMLEDNQRRNLDRIDRVTGKGPMGGGDNRYPNSKLRQPGHMLPQQMGSSTSVRDFFRERRELEAKGGYVPPINQHYNQAKGRTGSGGSLKKNSAGIDRAQPLAPIQARHKGISSAPAETPFSNKPRLVKHHSGNAQRRDNNNNTPGGYHNDVENSPAPPASNRTQGRAPAGLVNKKTSPPPKGVANGPSAGKHSAGDREEKLSDFQKWQLEQNKTREERLKKLNMRGPRGGGDSDRWGREDEEEEEDTDAAAQEEIERKQRELMERIAAQQAELDRLRREREEEEEMRASNADEERREAEMSRKQQAAEEKRRRQQEEARRRREEEEERRIVAATAASMAAARSQPSPQRQRYDFGRYNGNVNMNVNENRSYPPSQEATPRASNRTTPQRPPPQPQPQRRAPREAPPARKDIMDDEEPVTAPGPGVDFYATAVDDGSGQAGRLVPCKLCGRKFADDRIAKHQAACKNAQKKRKEFDPVQMRTDGTDMAKYIRKGAHKKEAPQAKKKDWRRQHEEFIGAIRYAKKMTQMEQAGVPLKDLPPPPPSDNSDLVPCPHCGRKFNDTAAERHIPRCKDLKTRPVAKGRR